MKFFFLFLWLSVAKSASSQVVGGVDLSKRPDVKYIQVNIAHILNVKKKMFDYAVGLDYGQTMTPESTAIMDASGQVVVFHSDMDAVNYLAVLGWRVVSIRNEEALGITSIKVVMERS